MDTEYLIAAVFVNSPIWDRRNKLHNNRSIVDKCWKQISTEMKVDEARLRKKWKYLRDQFSVESGKIQLSRSGDSGTDTITKWPYFQSLLYLKDVIKPRQSTGNNKTSTSRDLSPKYNEDDDQAILMEDEDNPPSVFSSMDHGDQPLPSEHYSSLLCRKRRAMMSASSSNDTLLDIEKEMLQFLQEKNKKNQDSDKVDEHVLFFKSLLPHVRKIPHHRLLSFRSRVQELAEQYAYETS